MTIDFHIELYVNAQSTDELITATLDNKCTCATLAKTLTATPFATMTQIQKFERFFDEFAPAALIDTVNDGSALKRPFQLSWRLQDGSMQTALREALADLPAHIAGTAADFSAFVPMGPVAQVAAGGAYIPGYLIVVTQEGDEACLWTYTSRARREDVVYEDDPDPARSRITEQLT